MLIIHQLLGHQLSTLLEEPDGSEINGWQLPKGEEIVPHFWLELVSDRISQDPENSFWWFPWLIIVDKLVVGMGGFKGSPNTNGVVEIGYGIIASQQKCGFATQAVKLLLAEGFSKAEIQTIEAYTTPENSASWRVLEKNQFVKNGNKIDPEDGEVWIWQKTRTTGC